MQVYHFISLIDMKAADCMNIFRFHFFCLYISMPAAPATIKRGPCAALPKNTAALHIPWRQASPACINSASFSWSGSSLPRASARRSIPKQAVLLK